MKLAVGNWVEVTHRRMDGPDLVMVGKVVTVTDELVAAECRTQAGPMRFAMEWDAIGSTHIRRMTQADWAKRKAVKYRGFRL